MIWPPQNTGLFDYKFQCCTCCICSYKEPEGLLVPIANEVDDIYAGAVSSLGPISADGTTMAWCGSVDPITPYLSAKVWNGTAWNDLSDYVSGVGYGWTFTCIDRANNTYGAATIPPAGPVGRVWDSDGNAIRTDSDITAYLSVSNDGNYAVVQLAADGSYAVRDMTGTYPDFPVDINGEWGPIGQFKIRFDDCNDFFVSGGYARWNNTKNNTWSPVCVMCVTAPYPWITDMADDGCTVCGYVYGDDGVTNVGFLGTLNDEVITYTVLDTAEDQFGCTGWPIPNLISRDGKTLFAPYGEALSGCPGGLAFAMRWRNGEGWIKVEDIYGVTSHTQTGTNGILSCNGDGNSANGEYNTSGDFIYVQGARYYSIPA